MSMATFELYLDSAGEWRWRMRHMNGQVIATSGESFANRENARQGAISVKANAFNAQVIVVAKGDQS